MAIYRPLINHISLALCLAASLKEHNGLNWQDFAKKMVAWWQDGKKRFHVQLRAEMECRAGYMSAVDRCFDIGEFQAHKVQGLMTTLNRNGDTPGTISISRQARAQ
jgi:hypothetical protein